MPALQVVLPWLLLLNQAITETSVVFTQGQGLPSSQSCSPSEYLIAGRCCKACPAGRHVGEHCRRPHSWGNCLPGTFMKYLYGVEACFKCSTCSKSKSAARAPSLPSNALQCPCPCSLPPLDPAVVRLDEEVLEECMPTHDRVCQCRSGYFYAHVGCSEICSLCSTCPTGHVVVRRCNATADMVCCLPAPRDPECVEMVTVVPGRGRASSISPSSVKLPQNSVSSMPSNQDRSAESSVPMRGNPNQPEDSVDIPTEAPAVTRALHSL